MSTGRKFPWSAAGGVVIWGAAFFGIVYAVVWVLFKVIDVTPLGDSRKKAEACAQRGGVEFRTRTPPVCLDSVAVSRIRR